jgi:3-oxoacyl-[acyl-carrier-protein] synthase II
MSSKRVVVTGVGVVSPIGIGATAFWSALLAGTSGIRRISAFDPGGFPCQIAGEVGPYKIGDFVPKSYRKATKVMARDIELAVIAADDAMKDAVLQTRAYVDPSPINSLRFGCNIGAGLISADLAELASAMNVARQADSPTSLDLHKWGTDGMGQLTPLWLLKYLPNMLACHVTIIHGLMGPSNTITCQEASSHLAIGEAFRTIQRGKADLAICGGAESRLNPMGLTRQHLLKRLTTTSNESPATALKPFDANATGSVLGEGGGLLILEEYEHAKARGAKIYAELAGFGASQDTHSPTEPDPTGYSYGKAVAKAIADAKATPADVNVVVPHGTGHAPTDAAELNGFKTVFGDGLAKPMFAPIKAQTGNPIAGCGVDVVATVLSVHTGKVPPAVNTTESALNVSKDAREASVNVAVTSTCSVGGQNAALVFRKV